jgi:hypothetical protein
VTPSGDVAAEPTVIAQSAVARNGLFVFLEAAFAVAFVRGVPGAATTAGSIAAATFTTSVAVGIGLLWRQAERGKSRLQITSESIDLVTRTGPVGSIRRDDGDELGFAMRGRSRYRIQTLVQSGTGTSLALPWFSRRPVVEACRARGWRFGASGSRSSSPATPTPPTPTPTPTPAAERSRHPPIDRASARVPPGHHRSR